MMLGFINFIFFAPITGAKIWSIVSFCVILWCVYVDFVTRLNSLFIKLEFIKLTSPLLKKAKAWILSTKAVKDLHLEVENSRLIEEQALALSNGRELVILQGYLTKIAIIMFIISLIRNLISDTVEPDFHLCFYVFMTSKALNLSISVNKLRLFSRQDKRHMGFGKAKAFGNAVAAGSSAAAGVGGVTILALGGDPAQIAPKFFTGKLSWSRLTDLITNPVKAIDSMKNADPLMAETKKVVEDLLKKEPENPIRGYKYTDKITGKSIPSYEAHYLYGKHSNVSTVTFPDCDKDTHGVVLREKVDGNGVVIKENKK